MSSGVSSPDLLTRLLADATLEAAYAWLCTQRQTYSHNSDVWAVRQHWPEVKDLIRREVAAGTYAFEPVQVYHIDGETRDVWAARDAIVLKALAIMLGAYFTLRLPRTISHLAERGGIKAAIRAVMDHLTAISHVMRLDVQSYYALTPGGLSPAVTTLNHCLERMIRLYEHGAGTARNGLYLRNWYRWVTAGGAWFADVCRLYSGSQRPRTRPRPPQWMGCKPELSDAAPGGL